MNSEELHFLLEKLQSGTISNEERQKLEAWDQLADKQEGLSTLLTDNEQAELRRRLWDNIDIQTVAGKIIPFSKNTKRKLYNRVTAAASILILITAGILYWINRSPKTDMAVQQPMQQQDVQPGGDKALLTLDDGTKIELDNAGKGLVAEQGDVSIIKSGDGILTYNATTPKTDKLRFNTISTPRGGQFKVVLPDGSEVWLNAASTLTYPTAFTGRERRVTLTGEGYFKVQHNAQQPFVVNVEQIEVHDLGTEFNINAYYDEPVIQTTLVEGLAEVKNGNNTSKLQPGDAAVVNGNNTEVKQVNAGNAAAWKNGLFQFEKAGIKTIMRQVSRWYNIDVAYEDAVPEKQITGKALRNSTLLEMLQILELSGIRFQLEEVPPAGRAGKIIVTQ